MPSNPRQIQRDAERRFPVRVRIAMPEGGFGRQFAVMRDWLDAVCGDGGWSSAPAGLIGIANDGVAFYFDDTAMAQAFVNRFCCGYRPIEVNRTVEGAFSLRGDASAPHRAALVRERP